MPATGNNFKVHTIDLIDETFDVSQSVNYSLCLQIASKGISFCVLDTLTGKYIVLRHYPCETGSDFMAFCSKIFDEDELLRLTYKSSRFLQVSERSTLVPAPLFAEKEAENILNFNHGKREDELTLFRYLPSAQAYSIFSVPAPLHSLLQKYQPGIQCFHHSQPLIEWSIEKNKSLSFFIYNDNMDIVILRDGRFIFYNSYHLLAPADAVYFLAGALNAFGLSINATELVYAGASADVSDCIELIKPFCSRITEIEPSNARIYSYYINETLRKQFIHLFNLHECVS
ncbi:MAG: DUF3822 family protein [Bacteroidales bacterium]|jgi:hypothetical protein|nr:DUF3822 family protein [Bacteroidales bacterium]